MAEQATQLAVVTGELAPDLSDGGTRLVASLAEHGIDGEPVMWNDPSVDWATYDAVLVRSCWEYPDDRDRFRTMLDELVVKPAVGAMSEQVWRTSVADVPESESTFAEQVDDHDVLVQSFVPAIETGERSMVFFGGEYSHAWNSLTTGDDVTSFDGMDADYEPTTDIREQGTDVIRAACEVLGMSRRELPYARVDYVPREGELVLMELELIEPFLGFDRGENTVERFTEALVSYYDAAA